MFNPAPVSIPLLKLRFGDGEDILFISHTPVTYIHHTLSQYRDMNLIQVSTVFKNKNHTKTNASLTTQSPTHFNFQMPFLTHQLPQRLHQNLDMMFPSINILDNHFFS
jgi:hypothetical protein